MKCICLICDNMILSAVGLRESKTFKEDFEKYLVSKRCCWAPGGGFKSAVTPDSQWLLQKAHLHWVFAFCVEAQFILHNIQVRLGRSWPPTTERDEGAEQNRIGLDSLQEMPAVFLVAVHSLQDSPCVKVQEKQQPPCPRWTNNHVIGKKEKKVEF